MYRGSLFERLRGTFDGAKMDDEKVLYQSIANNLANIFLTYTGSVETVLDYGKIDLNNMDLTPLNSQKKIERYLEKSISLYEKRLSYVSVSIIENQYNISTIRIHIEGVMSVNGEEEKAVFKAKIYGDGFIKVHSYEYQ
jgi:type VI secretion system protein